MIKIGDKISNLSFNLPDGTVTNFDKYKGKNIIIYFYPKDDTPGCTQEACDFRDNIEDFKQTDTVVFGVSRDDQKSHDKFSKKYNLPFTLISDSEEKLCQYFDVIKPKKLYGKDYIGIERSTFLIDKKGVLRKEWRGVKVPGHIDEIKKELDGGGK